MDFFVARAMQIASLEHWQINDLHGMEERKGRLYQNCEIQSVFGMPTLKDRWSIPEDNNLQAAHAARIRSQLLTQRVAMSEARIIDDAEKPVIIPPWHSLTPDNPTVFPQFDRAVREAADAGKIVFNFQGGVPAKKRFGEAA